MRKLLLIAILAVVGTPSVAAEQEGLQPPYGNPVVTPEASSYGQEAAFTGGGLDARETRLSNRIRDGENAGTLSRTEANRDFQALSRIRLYEIQHAQPNGYLPGDTQARVSQQLKKLDDAMKAQPGRLAR